MKKSSIHYVMSLHKGYWFSRSTMDFFKTRLSPSLVYETDDGKYIFFVSSDQWGSFPRFYNINKLTVSTGDIETVEGGPETAYTKNQAKSRMLALIREYE